MKPHRVMGSWGGFEKSNRGNYFEGRHWALCWCGLTQQAKAHRLARTRKLRAQ